LQGIHIVQSPCSVSSCVAQLPLPADRCF
jgi:hypothetical protein